MPNSPDPDCPVCRSPLRYNVEQAYLTSQPVPFTRLEMERHLAHLTDPQSLATVKGLGSTAALASRLRQLEVAATAILDVALQQQDGTLAVRALREARQTIVELSRLGRELAGGAAGADARPDLDDAIARYVGARLADEGEQADDALDVEGTERTYVPPLALGAGGQSEAQ